MKRVFQVAAFAALTFITLTSAVRGTNYFIRQQPVQPGEASTTTLVSTQCRFSESLEIVTTGTQYWVLVNKSTPTTPLQIANPSQIDNYIATNGGDNAFECRKFNLIIE